MVVVQEILFPAPHIPQAPWEELCDEGPLHGGLNSSVHLPGAGG